MQFYIDGNQVVESEFSTKIKEPELIKFLNKSTLELHLKADAFFIVNSQRQKIEISIEKSLNYHKNFFYKNSIYTQPLFKALGVKKGIEKPKVFDCTAGMLKDSLLIYSALGELTSSERNPLIALLIIESLKKTPLENFNFNFGQCKEQDFSGIDTIYYDPMYKMTNQKAAPKKEMQFFRDAVGEDDDILDTFEFLLSLDKRVVSKRSQKASPIKLPSMSFGQKSTIYDVYL